MRRHKPPFNGLRFVLNKSTGEIHDLDNEKPQCQIDEIKPEHIHNCDSYSKAQVARTLLSQNKRNGCYNCNPSKDNG